MSLGILISVAAGGALGAVGRYVMSFHVVEWLGSEFPFATLLVNILGALVMGALIAAMSQFWAPSEPLRAFLTVGVLGAFTTFSLFSMDLFRLLDGGETVAAALYVGASVGLALAGFVVGHWLVRLIFA